MLFRDAILKYVTVVNRDSKYIIWFKMNKSLFSFENLYILALKTSFLKEVNTHLLIIPELSDEISGILFSPVSVRLSEEFLVT